MFYLVLLLHTFVKRRISHEKKYRAYRFFYSSYLINSWSLTKPIYSLIY
ncbi:hypothetical protein FN960_11665 [Alkalicoccobacillus porphyridii]|uniref:Uncharacterized protein n=1 Tax=Alkalicoccobacillus porphyridii TaxID=2597270 RepID=A0A553ZYC7_9BACI|nr:hypothetical protein FN960_11665 [Alkalicoccobacillus porphyridii]